MLGETPPKENENIYTLKRFYLLYFYMRRSCVCETDGTVIKGLAKAT